MTFGAVCAFIENSTNTISTTCITGFDHLHDYVYDENAVHLSRKLKKCS